MRGYKEYVVIECYECGSESVVEIALTNEIVIKCFDCKKKTRFRRVEDDAPQKRLSIKRFEDASK